MCGSFCPAILFDILKRFTHYQPVYLAFPYIALPYWDASNRRINHMQQRERYMELPKNVFDVIYLNMTNILEGVLDCHCTVRTIPPALLYIFTGVFNLNTLLTEEWRECVSYFLMQGNLLYSKRQHQSTEPGCYIYNRTLSSNGVPGEGWRECGKQTWLHPSAFQITGGGEWGRGTRGVAWCICCVQAQGERSCRDKEIT